MARSVAPPIHRVVDALFLNLDGPAQVAAQSTSQSSRQKVLTWGPIDVQDGGGIVASKIRNMTLTIIEERSPRREIAHELFHPYHR